MTPRPALLFLVPAFVFAQEALPLERGRAAVERLAEARLAAVQAARQRLAAQRKDAPALGVYREYKAVQHIHAQDSNHTFGTREEVLRAAKATGVSVVMFTDHGSGRPDTWQGLRDGVLFFKGTEGDHKQTYPEPAPGLRFHCHVEEQLDLPLTAAEGLDGMEIYNRHSDLTDDVDFLAWVKKLQADAEGRRQFAALARRYPDEVYGAGAHYDARIFERWDKILATRHFPGVSANDAHQNQIFDDGAGGKVTLDPYDVAFRNVSTHILAREFNEEAIQHALRRGRSFVAHDWLADARTARAFLVNTLGVYELGDTIPMSGTTRMVVVTPVPAVVRVFHNGRVIGQQTGTRVTVEAKQPGVYRAEAWLEIDGEMRPWIYFNPIYAETLNPLTAMPPQPAQGANVEIARGLAYVETPVEAEKQKLDVYHPKDAQRRPVLFFLHGGSWRSGDRSQYFMLGNRFAQEGYVVVIPSYRLSPKHAWPAHIEDAAAAFAWTTRHVGEYGGDPDRILVAGHSAGGHLAALLALDESWPARYGANLKGVRGVAALSGVFDVQFGGETPPAVFKGAPEEMRKASPVHFVRRGAPPFVVQYCQWDYATLPQQAEAFHQALLAAGAGSALRYIQGESHISEMLYVARPDNALALLLAQLLKDLEPR